MPPPMKKMKTYGPSNTSLVNNSVDAFNVLFSNQRRKPIIKKKRKKMEHLTTELLTRPKYTSALTKDSFQISMEDTFDKVKQSSRAPASNLIDHSTFNKSESLNKSEVGRFISAGITIHSPILTRRRKNFLDSSNSLQISEITDSYDKTHKKRLKESSHENIDVSLEIESVKDKQYSFSSLSYINVPNKVDSFKIPNSFNGSKLGVSINTFSKLLTNCSTPVSQFKHPNLINQTMSPVKMNSLVQEDNSMLHTQSKNLDKTEDKSKSIKSESFNNTPQKRKSFINLRKRKILKSNGKIVKNKSLRKYLTSTLPSSSYFESLESFDSEKQRFALTKSLESFTKFENKIAYMSKKHDDSKGYKSFGYLLSPDNFVTKRRAISNDIESNGLSVGLEEGKDIDTNKKKLAIKLQRLPIISTKSELESDYEQIYSHNISKELDDTKLENETDVSSENANNYICSQNSDQCVDISFVNIKKKLAPDDDNLEANKDEFENKIAYISKKYDDSKDKSYGYLVSPDNFVTKRRAVSKDIFESNDLSLCSEEVKDMETNKKKLAIKLQRLSTGLESDFEKFYSLKISKELDDTKLENKTDVILENFEQNVCSQNSEQCAHSLETNKDEFEKFYVSHYSFTDSKDVDRINAIPDTVVLYKSLDLSNTDNDIQDPEINGKKGNIKDLRVNITKGSLRSQKNQNIVGVSNDLNTDNIEKEIIKDTDNVPRSNDEIIYLTDSTIENIAPQANETNGFGHNGTLRINLTKNNFSDNTVKCNTANNKSPIDFKSNFLQVDKKNCNVEIQNLMVDVLSQIENFDNNNFDICDFPLSSVEDIVAEQEKNLDLVDEESLDVIESSYNQSQLLNKTTKKLCKSNNFTLDTKCERLQAFSEITPNKSDKSGTVQSLNFFSSTTTSVCQKFVNNSCDIVDTPKGSFKMPKSPPIHLKGGKSWKRSMSIYRNSISGFSKEDDHSSYLGKTCPKGKPSRLSNLKCRRLSVCMAPMSILELENTTQNPLVEYAVSNRYVPDQIIEDSLEDSFRCLSLNHVSTLNKKSRLDQVPITAKDVVLRKCGQTEPLEFSKCFPDSILTHCQKIGEGVFGEVFLFRNPKGGTSVIKIVPVEGDLIVNGERQKKFEEVLSEIIITMELSNLRNNKRNGMPAFTEVQKIQCVQGKYPEKLIFLWDEYDETRHSENDCPDIFRDDQLYIVFQMAYGGKDLEAFEFNNAIQAYSMFQQVAIGLAVAEEELHFEHRDLHWGNVLVSAVETKKMVSFNLNSRNYELPTQGVEIAIIDFTLSRIENNGVVIFNDLSMDPDLFVAEGDYQFDIYRLMQDKNRNNWKDFEPFTNLLWLHYILDKAIRALRYKNIKSKKHREYIRKLKMLKEDVLCYHNVKEFVFAKLLDIM